MRKATTIGIAILAPVLLSGCDYLRPDPGKAVITTALSGAPVQTSIEAAYEALTATCFRQGTFDTVVNVNIGDKNNSNWQKMSFTLDQAELISTLFHKSSENPVAQINNQTLTCFDEEIRTHKSGGWLAGLSYDLPLGTAHVASIDFINEFTSSGMFGQAEMRSYRVNFSIDQEHPTGEGTMPVFTTTCLLMKDPVQNEWRLQSC